MSEASRAIEASGLVKTYPGGVRALDGLSFEVEAGTVSLTDPASLQRTISIGDVASDTH
jgi:hypothetical protein